MPSSVRLIKTTDAFDAVIMLPPSKSYTNRALMVASLAEGPSTIINPSTSDDALIMIDALRAFGVSIDHAEQALHVEGTGGAIHAPSHELDLGNAGTAMRFIISLAALAHGETRLTGNTHMQRRPVKDLLGALASCGVRSSSNNGCPPLSISGTGLTGGPIAVKGGVSSQFISSLLLVSPYASKDVSLRIQDTPSSFPYIDMSLHVMRSFGADVTARSPLLYQISCKQQYIGREFVIERDASGATYFLGAAAITGGRVTIRGFSHDSFQGDARFIDILGEMGCKIEKGAESMSLQGAILHGTEIDMNAMPDCVPALAVVAAFAQGSTTISNIAHLRFKESNRLQTLATELRRIGAAVELMDDGLIIHPRKMNGARIETYDDHRLAMSFAMAGLRVPNIEITNPECVSKSFPDFWKEFSKLESKEH